MLVIIYADISHNGQIVCWDVDELLLFLKLYDPLLAVYLV